MARDLVWLENHSFSAWGCSECAWIKQAGPALSAKTSASVRPAFARHDCTKFPRHISPKEKRPPRSVAL
jgi:hypothetical protein